MQLRFSLILGVLILAGSAPTAMGDMFNPENCYAVISDPYPFTVAPCGGDEMPIIDAYIIGWPDPTPVEVLAQDIWMDHPSMVQCVQVIADSSTFAPDPGHTTISGIQRFGMEVDENCSAHPFQLIVVGQVFAVIEFDINTPDLNGDGQVSVADFGLFAGNYGSYEPCADLNESGGDVTVADFSIFASFFNDCDCP